MELIGTSTFYRTDNGALLATVDMHEQVDRSSFDHITINDNSFVVRNRTRNCPADERDEVRDFDAQVESLIDEYIGQRKYTWTETVDREKSHFEAYTFTDMARGIVNTLLREPRVNIALQEDLSPWERDRIRGIIKQIGRMRINDMLRAQYADIKADDTEEQKMEKFGRPGEDNPNAKEGKYIRDSFYLNKQAFGTAEPVIGWITAVDGRQYGLHKTGDSFTITDIRSGALLDSGYPTLRDAKTALPDVAARLEDALNTDSGKAAYRDLVERFGTLKIKS